MSYIYLNELMVYKLYRNGNKNVLCCLDILELLMLLVSTPDTEIYLEKGGLPPALPLGYIQV